MARKYGSQLIVRSPAQVRFSFHWLSIILTPARLGGRLGPLLPSSCQGGEQCRLHATHSFVLVHAPFYSIFDAEPFTAIHKYFAKMLSCRSPTINSSHAQSFLCAPPSSHHGDGHSWLIDCPLYDRLTVTCPRAVILCPTDQILLLTQCAMVATTCRQLHLACRWILRTTAMMTKDEQALSLVRLMGFARSKYPTQPGSFHRS